MIRVLRSRTLPAARSVVVKELRDSRTTYDVVQQGEQRRPRIRKNNAAAGRVNKKIDSATES